MNCDFFKQEGIVVAISEENELSIAVNVCSACHASGSCHMAHKRIIKTKTDKIVKVDDKVLVSINKSFGFKSIFFCYLLPFILMIAALSGSFAVANNELIAAISSLLALTAYYIFLYFFNKIKGYNSNFIVEIIE